MTLQTNALRALLQNNEAWIQHRAKNPHTPPTQTCRRCDLSVGFQCDDCADDQLYENLYRLHTLFVRPNRPTQRGRTKYRWALGIDSKDGREEQDYVAGPFEDLDQALALSVHNDDQGTYYIYKLSSLQEFDQKAYKFSNLLNQWIKLTPADRKPANNKHQTQPPNKQGLRKKGSTKC